MAGSANRRPDHPGGHEIGEAIIWCVKRGEFCDGTAPICDDHFFASLHPVDVLAQSILEIAYPDL